MRLTACLMDSVVTASRVSSRSMSICSPVALVTFVRLREVELISLTPLTRMNSSKSCASSSANSAGRLSAPSIFGAAAPWR